MLLKKANAIFHFYRTVAMQGLLLSGAAGYLLYSHGAGVFGPLLLLKLLVWLIVFVYVGQTRKNSFYYYYNLHIRGVFLWSTAIFFDLILFIAGTILISALR